MPYKLLMVFALLVVVCVPAFAQEEPAQKPTQEPTQEPTQKNVWSWAYKTEVRANYRWSEEATVPRPFPPGAQLTTVDPGDNVELNVADVQLDLDYGEWFKARALVHGQALHRRNPTSTDKKVDADELWVRLGLKPEFLDRPDSTSFFIQAGKFPKMERQPVRLLESYGLAATSFNRFEDVQLQIGGTIGRNFYWRAQAANGNPFFMRDPNALAGDNGTRRQVIEGRAPELGSGFPILYNAETEDLFFDAKHVQYGEGLGYRWQRPDETLGFDAIVFHYSRDMADKVELTGTVYGGDLDFLIVRGSEVGSPIDRGLPISGNKKEELGARVYSEWHAATAIAQYTTQKVAGLEREGWELELGYRIPLSLGPLESIQPAVRASNLDNHFVSHPQYPAVSTTWDWRKYDAGIRVGFTHGLDVTVEYSTHHMTRVAGPLPFHLNEILATVRWRV